MDAGRLRKLSLPNLPLWAAGGIWLCISPDRLQSSHPLPSGIFPYTVFVGPKRWFVSVCVLDCVCTHIRTWRGGCLFPGNLQNFPFKMERGLSASWKSAELSIREVVVPSARPQSAC